MINGGYSARCGRHTPVLPALRKMKWEVCEFWASLGYMVRTRLKTSPAENLAVETGLPMMTKGTSERTERVKGKMAWGPNEGV